VAELHDLEPSYKTQFLIEMSAVAFPIGPVYYVDRSIWKSEKVRPSDEEREILKRTLLRESEKTAGEYILRRSVNAC
jgi:hypothetical protein